MKLYLLYFSPTGGVRQVAQKVVQALMEQWESSVSLLEHDFTLPEQREQVPTFTADDVVFLALPVYAGRVPNLILPYLNRLCGNGAKEIGRAHV